MEVFGESEIELRQTTEDQLVVEIRGLEVYEPTTGVLRSPSATPTAS